jgi:DNA (cytosine-5)-methyltransferase 1
MKLTVLELCAGGGGQALGLEEAGFQSAAAIELDPKACETLRSNRPGWNTLQCDIRKVDGADFKNVDLIAGGVPCPPFSVAGQQLGREDERDLFPAALDLIEKASPTAAMLENVPGFASAKFGLYRRQIAARLDRLGYEVDARVLSASDFGVPQLRPRFVLVAIKRRYATGFRWPEPLSSRVSVSSSICDLMAARGWQGLEAWKERASGIAPTIVGGSRKHGGPDLGPTRAKRQWLALGIDGLGIADEAPGQAFPRDGFPRLTVRMVARLQGFPDSWVFAGGKTASYRQVGNAFPPPVAAAVARGIRAAIASRQSSLKLPRFALVSP